mgnify:CR=1 FL=1
MNTSGEAAEQIVRMSLEGFEVAAKIHRRRCEEHRRSPLFHSERGK